MDLDAAAERVAVEMALSGEARRLRLAAGLTQMDVALLVGTDQSTISRLERGRHLPLESTTKRYGRLLIELEATL
jgi:transcriptional regulator with XRE-family HTH domain